MSALKINSPYFINVTNNASLDVLCTNTWITVLHASRIPPHIGLIINGRYNSLTIKGQETNIDLAVLLKTIQQKKIETVFIKLKKHPVFSLDYQQEIFMLQLNQFLKVKANEASCLSPVKLFLNEFYAMSIIDHELFFELTERLKQNDYIDNAISLNSDNKLQSNHYYFPLYSYNELQNVIEKEHSNLHKK